MGDAGSDAGRLDGSAFLDPYRAVVERSCPDALPAALRLWARLAPDRWPLEWHLPAWLGDAFGLDREVSTAIVLSNVLGLASVRLRDDLADDEVELADLAAAEPLSRVFYDAAVDVYRRSLAPSSPFWARLGAWMAEWSSVTLASASEERGHLPAGDARRLAARGAPLKVSALAVCLLTGRERDFAQVEACVDHALTAMVLYDDACDWEDDLAAGRWNAFVAAASGTPGPAGRRGRDRSHVLVAMMASGMIGTYFADIERELGRATAIARRLGIGPLAVFLEDLAGRFGEEATALDRRYEGIGERAAGLVFGPGWRDPIPLGSGAGTA